MSKFAGRWDRAASLVTVGLLLLAPTTFSLQQRDVKALLASLKNKVLLLRQPARGTSLTFDASGQLIKGQAANRIYGWLEVKRAKQKKQKLLIEANRLLHVYDPQAQKFIQYRSGEVVIEVAPLNRDTTAVEDAIGKMFAFGEPQPEHIVPDVTPEGRPIGEGGVLRTLSNGEQVYRVGGDVKMPRVISSPDPEYSEEARKGRFSGVVSLWAVVDEAGAVKHLEIVKPAGYGLEAQAIDAVSNWKFEPATLNGKPVPVEIVVEVNFRLT